MGSGETTTKKTTTKDKKEDEERKIPSRRLRFNGSKLSARPALTQLGLSFGSEEKKKRKSFNERGLKKLWSRRKKEERRFAWRKYNKRNREEEITIKI